MSRVLTNNKNIESQGVQLTRNQTKKFKIGICGKLQNNFTFKGLNASSIKSFHNFINCTVGEGLSITEVEKLYLRKRGRVVREETVNGCKREVIHLGKDMKSFRIFGYYNEDGYFNITKIDPKHKAHKE